MAKVLVGRIALRILLAILISDVGEAKKLKSVRTEGKVRVVQDSKPAQSPPYVPVEEVVITQPTTYRDETTQQEAYITRHIHKPKSLKVMSAYDVCKAECRKARDQESAKEYVERLKEELRQAEDHERLLAQQQQQADLAKQREQQQAAETVLV